MSHKVHKTFLGKIFGPIGDAIKSFFAKAWDEADHDILEFSVKVTEALKDGLQSGVVKAIVDNTHTDIDNNILAAVNAYMPKLLADELLLKDINETSTEADVQAIAKQIVDSFGGMSSDDKEQFYTNVSAKIYKLAIQIKNGEHITFGQAAMLVESAYKQWQKSQD